MCSQEKELEMTNKLQMQGIAAIITCDEFGWGVSNFAIK